MNRVPAVVVFYSTTTRSFMSLALTMRFNDTPGELYFPLNFEIDDDRPVRFLRVHRVCILKVFSKRYSVEFVPILFQKMKVIVGMNGWRPYGDIID